MGKLIRVVIWILVARSVLAADPNTVFLPGQEVLVDANSKDAGGGFMVYVPAEYNETQNWPVIFYYHGAGEQLSTQRFQTATGSKGFIIVAMEFGIAPKGTITQGQYTAYIQRELKSMGAARVYVAKHLKIDRERILLAGVSKGGWLVADMADLNPSPWAGIAIFCAGRHRFMNPAGVRGKNIYIGTGETDQNLEAAKNAAEDYRRRGAKVVLDIYPGLGHAVDPNSQTLRKWLNDVRKEQRENNHPKHDPNAPLNASVK
jgi:predicted peptidase